MLQEKQVVTCFLESEGKILLLRRSERVGSYQKRWAGVSGYIESNADEQALIEIEEETALGREDVELGTKGEPLEVLDENLGIRWVVHPYLFQVKNRGKIRIDWEHKETKWIEPKDIVNYQTVPKLKEALSKVYSITR